MKIAKLIFIGLMCFLQSLFVNSNSFNKVSKNLEVSSINSIGLSNNFLYLNSYSQNGVATFNSSHTNSIEKKEFKRQPPLERLRMILEYYYQDSLSEVAFNKSWNVSQIKLILAKIAPYRKYYIAELDFLAENIHKREQMSEKMPLTKFLINYEAKLSNAVYHGKMMGKNLGNDLDSINGIFKGERFTLSLSEAQKTNLVSKEVSSKIAKGGILITDKVYNRFKNQLTRLTKEETNALIQNYEQYINLFLKTISANYLGGKAAEPVHLQLQDILSQEGINGGIYTKRFSHEFVYSFLVKLLNERTGDLYISTCAVKDAFQQLALANYAELISQRKLAFSTPRKGIDEVMFKRDSSGIIKGKPVIVFDSRSSQILKVIGNLYKKGKVNYVRVTKRKYSLSENIVFEKGLVVLTSGRMIKYNYQGQIPFNLINRAAFNQEYIRKVDYSFFSRVLRLKYSPNSPFFEFIDIIENYPVECLAYLRNGINTGKPIHLTINEIRLNVSSGHPRRLFKDIGLKIGYQKDTTVLIRSMSDVFSQIKKSNKISNQADSLINSTPSKFLSSTYNQICYEPFPKYENFEKYLNALYGVSAAEEAKTLISKYQQNRAANLPQKRDCNGCYDVFYCNKEANKKLNDTRYSVIGSMQRSIESSNQILSQLSNTNLLVSKGSNEFVPLGSVYDRKSKEFFNFFQLSKNGIGCIYGLKFKKSVAGTVKQIVKINDYIKMIDPYFLQRYNVDLSNLSDHGYEYLIQLFNFFQYENSNDNRLLDKLLQEGLLNLSYESQGFSVGKQSFDNQFLDHFFIAHYMFLQERSLIATSKNMPVLNSDGLQLQKSVIEETQKSISIAIQPTINEISANFDKAEKVWREFTVFVGISVKNGVLVPVASYSSGSISITLSGSLNEALPVIPMPNVRIPNIQPTTLN